MIVGFIIPLLTILQLFSLARLPIIDNARLSLLRECPKSVVTDFSVMLFRPTFMLASEEHPMKVHKNQWLLTIPSPPDTPCGATNQGTHHGVWGAVAFAVT
jgi:hypothetical protein